MRCWHQADVAGRQRCVTSAVENEYHGLIVICNMSV